MAKFRLKQPEIDLAADANHRHISGTSFHWKHGYIPLDARTATLFHKKAAAKALIESGKVSIHEPEGVKTINSRGLRATRTLNIVPASPKVQPKAPEPKPETPSSVKPITPSLAKSLARSEHYDARAIYGKFEKQGMEQGLLERKIIKNTLPSGREIEIPTTHLTDKGRAHLEAHRAGLRPTVKVKAGATPRNEYDSLLSPKSGDILTERGKTYIGRDGTPVASPARRYRFSGSTWVKETPNGNGTWRQFSSSKPTPGALMSDVKRGSIEIEGIEPDKIQGELDSRRSAHEAESLKAAQKAFGKEKVNGFRAVSGHEALRTSMGRLFSGSTELPDPGKAVDALTKDYVPEPGMIHLMHDNGTQILVHPAVAKKGNTESLHRLAGVVNDVTENYTHDTAVGSGSKHGPVVFHADPTYEAGGRWITTKNHRRREVLGYVQRGDTQNVHISPNTALVNTKEGTVGAMSGFDAHGHFAAGHTDLPTRAHGTLIHELGHVADNRTNDTGLTAPYGQHPEARDFHADIFGGPLSGKVSGAGYARTNAAEGYAEAFTHAVANRHLTELAKNKRRAVEDEAARTRRAAHDAATAKYEAKYGFFIPVKGSTP